MKKLLLLLPIIIFLTGCSSSELFGAKKVKEWEKPGKEHLKIKTDKSRILSYRVIKETRKEKLLGAVTDSSSTPETFSIIELSETPTSTIEYEYISDNVIPQEESELVDNRTSNSIEIVNQDGSHTIKSYLGDIQKNINGSWHKIEYATTTVEAFDAQYQAILGATSTASTNNKDARIDGYTGNANTNYGSIGNIDIYNYLTWQVVRTVINITLPSGSGNISDVKLYLYKLTAGAGNNTSLFDNAHQLTRTNWTEAGVTNNKYDGTNNWTTAGGDYSATVIDGAPVNANSNIWLNWVLKGTGSDNPLTLTWGDTVNLLLKGSTETTAHDISESFASKEYTTDTTKRPYVEVTYTPSSASKPANIINID